MDLEGRIVGLFWVHQGSRYCSLGVHLLWPPWLRLLVAEQFAFVGVVGTVGSVGLTLKLLRINSKYMQGS